jgi:hypothetical protein
MSLRSALALLQLLLMLASLPAAAPAAAEVRAVFVGINQYKFSRPKVPEAGFADLQGAVADTVRIKAALAGAHGLVLDAPGAGCRSQNSLSITLTDACATKADILAAWKAMIEASASGDTLILYFAGHGSRRADTRAFSQASGFYSTLMAHDARDPEAPGDGEIVDVEVRKIIDTATARGIRVVTWFDSCNSGTANRSGNAVSRWAPPLALPGPPREAVPAIAASRQPRVVPGWRVHFAASADGQDALERPPADRSGSRVRAGLFTSALAAAIEAAPQASFADLAARVRAEVAQATEGRQMPQAEGALQATLTGREIRLPTFAVARRGEALEMTGGSLAGVRVGSRFALYGDMRSALGSGAQPPLAMARVMAADGLRATLQAQPPATAALPAQLFARELHHDFGSYRLPLAVADPAALAVVKRLDFVTVQPQAGFRLAPLPAGMGAGMGLGGPDGQSIAVLPPAGDPEFPLRLAAALEKIARVEAWLAGLQARDGLALCLWTNGEPPGNAVICPSPPPAGLVLTLGQEVGFSVRNQAATPRHIYLLAILPDYGVMVVLPANQGFDSALGQGGQMRSTEISGLKPGSPGRYRFVGLSTTAPIDPGVLAQSGAGELDVDACLGAGGQIFCPDATRTRSGTGVRPPDDWSAVIINARVPS